MDLRRDVLLGSRLAVTHGDGRVLALATHAPGLRLLPGQQRPQPLMLSEFTRQPADVDPYYEQAPRRCSPEAGTD